MKHCILENNINYMDFLHDMERSGSSEGAKMSSRNFHRGTTDLVEPDFTTLESIGGEMTTSSLDAKFLEWMRTTSKISEGDDWPGR